MTQTSEAVCLLCGCEDLGLNLQNPHKLDKVVLMQSQHLDRKTTVGGGGVERQENSPEAHRSVTRGGGCLGRT